MSHPIPYLPYNDSLWKVEVKRTQNQPIGSFRCCFLNRLPPDILQLKQLTQLDLSGNLLSQLPEEIEKLKQLKVLILNDNQLISLPNSFPKLQNLESLSLSGNPISAEALDAAKLDKLKSLTTLYLCRLTLSFVPKSISQLSKLQKLSLADNKLEHLPSFMSQLVSLEWLSLKGNPLNGLNLQVLTAMRQLKYLSISHTSLTPAEELEQLAIFRPFLLILELSFVNTNYGKELDENMTDQKMNLTPDPPLLLQKDLPKSPPKLPPARILTQKSIQEIRQSAPNLSEMKNQKQEESAHELLKRGKRESLSYIYHLENLNYEDITYTEIDKAPPPPPPLKNLSMVGEELQSGEQTPKQKDFGSHELRTKVEEPTFKCQKCKEKIELGAFIEALDFMYHTDCFKCNECDKNLDQEYFHKSEMNEPAFYCKDCFDQPKCFVCHETCLKQEAIEFENRFYHQAHFCCHECGRLLNKEQGLFKREETGDLICPQCFDSSLILVDDQNQTEQKE